MILNFTHLYCIKVCENVKDVKLFSIPNST